MFFIYINVLCDIFSNFCKAVTFLILDLHFKTNLNYWNKSIHKSIYKKYIKYEKSLKRTFQTGFWVQNNRLNLCSRVMNSQRLFCSQKTVWNVRIKAFLYMYKYILDIFHIFVSAISNSRFLQTNLKNPAEILKRFKSLLGVSRQ